MSKLLKYTAVTFTLFLATSCGNGDDAMQGEAAIPEEVIPAEVVPENEMPQELAAEVVECPATVAEGETRTFSNRNSNIDYIIFVIEPDVTVQFGSGAGVTVYGSIQAAGTDEKPIVFTGEDKVAGAWKGIFIQSDDTANALVHTQIDYAGGGAFNSNGDLGSVIVYADTRLNMSNSTITNSAAYGINASYGGGEFVFENNTITTSDAPMTVEGAYPTAITGGSFTGNTLDAIIVTGDQITGEHIWSRKPSFIAVGTEQDPVIFTGINKVPGAWNGIRFDTPSVLNEIGFATIEYASSTNLSGAVYLWHGSVVNVHDVTFRDIKFCAFTAAAGAPNLTQSNIEYVNVAKRLVETTGSCI